MINDMNGAQQNLELEWSHEKYNNFEHCHVELEELLNMKEAMAKEKARIYWLREGDRNTTLFHASIKARRKQNKMILHREDGTSTFNSLDVRAAVVEYYRNLFNK